jgi:hypothetical protein
VPPPVVRKYNLRSGAEVVGNWIWITFYEQPEAQVRQELSQLGFHWNNVRKCWQHPCGHVAAGTKDDPRHKYGSKFIAHQQAA